MDYLKFYELEKAPFQNDPDEHFFFESAGHRRALAHLGRGIDQHKALSVLVGEAGCGKTTLATRIHGRLDPQEYRAQLLLISHADCASGWLLPAVARAFGVSEPADTAPTQLVQIRAAFVAHRKNGRHPVLMVDEAQLLSNMQVMEEFRGILNLTLDGARLVSMLLFGLPELSELLRLDAPLAQRVEVRADVAGLHLDELKSYVKYRLEQAGGPADLFTDNALDAIHAYGRGVPRVTNTLADGALFEAFLSETRPVDASLVSAAAEQLQLETVPPAPAAVPTAGTDATQGVPVSPGPPTGMLGIDPTADELPDGPKAGTEPLTDSTNSQQLGLDPDLQDGPDEESTDAEGPSETEAPSLDLGDDDGLGEALVADSDDDSASEDLVLEDLEGVDVELEAFADAPEPESALLVDPEPEAEPIEDDVPDTSTASDAESQFDLADLLEADDSGENDVTDTGHHEDLPVQAEGEPEAKAAASDDGETFDPAELLLLEEDVVADAEAKAPAAEPKEATSEELDELFDNIQLD